MKIAPSNFILGTVLIAVTLSGCKKNISNICQNNTSTALTITSSASEHTEACDPNKPILYSANNLDWYGHIGEGTKVPAQEYSHPSKRINPQEMTRQDLKKEIYEIEDMIFKMDTGIADNPLEAVGIYLVRGFQPLMYLGYYEKKVTYIEKYGTEKQKEELRKIQAEMEKEVDEGKNAIFNSKYYIRLRGL